MTLSTEQQESITNAAQQYAATLQTIEEQANKERQNARENYLSTIQRVLNGEDP